MFYVCYLPLYYYIYVTYLIYSVNSMNYIIQLYLINSCILKTTNPYIPFLSHGNQSIPKINIHIYI